MGTILGLILVPSCIFPAVEELKVLVSKLVDLTLNTACIVRRCCLHLRVLLSCLSFRIIGFVRSLVILLHIFNTLQGQCLQFALRGWRGVLNRFDVKIELLHRSRLFFVTSLHTFLLKLLRLSWRNLGLVIFRPISFIIELQALLDMISHRQELLLFNTEYIHISQCPNIHSTLDVVQERDFSEVCTFV